MDSLQVFVGHSLAGELKRNSGGISFRYIEGYIGAPVFLNWPVHQAARHWQDLPTELACLLPEGVQLDKWRESDTTDRSDWGLLAAVGADLPGLISVLPADGQSGLLGREAAGLKRPNRARIRPEVDALPYSERDLAEFNTRVGFGASMASRKTCVNAIYSRKKQSFQLVKGRGSYRLTPEPKEALEWVQNQLLTAQLAHDAGLVVAPVGRVRATDGVPILWAERFDRSGASNCQRSRLENACQLLGKTFATKYDGSVEAIARLIRQYCTNPKIQLMRLFHRVLFSWLTGDSGLHLKKWSLLQNGSIIELSPAYGLMNHTLLGQEGIESALSLNDRRIGFDRACLLEYLGKEVCGLNDRIITRVMKQLEDVPWERRMLESGLSKRSQRAYFELVNERWRMLKHA